ncbi:MAG: hypothetical protein HY963_04815 [Ignavibacteriales bacterium]|nr:hypothetical protein [Ignavibacteriales bacterium]
MDNIFQLLILLFVIYTIYNSLFGKKKPQRPQNNFPRDETGEAETKASPQPQYSSTDILQDLFGFKIPKSEDEYGNLPRRNYPGNLEIDLPEIEEESDSEKRNVPDINYDKLISLEVQQIKTLLDEPHIAYEVGSSFNRRTIDIKQKIKNPASLQELYLISEIINKPKAIRR